MPTYEYKARDNAGKIVKGKIEADTKVLVLGKIKEMGVMAVSITEVKSSSSKIASKNIFSFGKVTIVEMNVFSQQLLTLLRAGLPLLKSLEAVLEQAQNAKLKEAINKIIIDVEAGTAFSSALSKYPSLFSKFYVNMIKVAEATGNLDNCLERIVILGNKEYEIQTKIKSATRYPLMVIFALVAGFIVIVKFVLPNFSKLFSRFNVSLPMPTRILLFINDFASKYFPFCVIGIVILAIVVNKFLKTSQGKTLWDGLKLKLPIFGDLFLNIAMSKFARTTGSLVGAGIPIMQVLPLTREVVNNEEISKKIRTIEEQLKQGRKISESMRDTKIFPIIIIQMVSVGEETGKLDELLGNVAQYYESQVDYKLQNLTAYIEPVLLLIMGVSVLFLALAMFLPMWNMVYLFKK